MVLEAIITQKKQDLQLRKEKNPLADLSIGLQKSQRDFRQALAQPHTGFILECKKASPSKGLLRADFNPPEIARSYAQFADAISVITDQPFFQGSLEYLKEVSQAVDCPVLCKDFVIDPYQVYEARKYGADAILLMMSVLDDKTFQTCLKTAKELNIDALVEIHDDQELKRALQHETKIIGINNRNLKTLEVDLSTTAKLAPQIPKDKIVICESGIGCHQDILALRDQVDGFLVGSSLVSQDDIDHAVRQLIFGRVKICGLTSQEDAQTAHRQGAMWGGLMFYPPSPRYVDPSLAKTLASTIPIKWAGVFVDESIDKVAELANKLDLAAIQLHGHEDNQYINQLRGKIPHSCAIWKAHRVENNIPDRSTTSADRFLLDNYDKNKLGGTGSSFDWSILRSHPDRLEHILAGGLNPENAALADQIGTWALDVSSGVEEIPGKKSQHKIQMFFSALRGAKNKGV
jgi:indole-3-glycerol phosphate synthase/phosphoribosylanthranilate isomerase